MADTINSLIALVQLQAEALELADCQIRDLEAEIATLEIIIEDLVDIGESEAE
jgi:hypothetical protein